MYLNIIPSDTSNLVQGPLRVQCKTKNLHNGNPSFLFLIPRFVHGCDINIRGLSILILTSMTSRRFHGHLKWFYHVPLVCSARSVIRSFCNFQWFGCPKLLENSISRDSIVFHNFTKNPLSTTPHAPRSDSWCPRS